jgi:hypothetical protein
MYLGCRRKKEKSDLAVNVLREEKDFTIGP